MTYNLIIGDRTYSSWSLRGWLMFDAFELPVSVQAVQMTTPGFDAGLKAFGPARLVPALRFDDTVVWDSIAIAETLAERHADRAFWPAGAKARGLARSLVAEMHSGFPTLRSVCPMNLSTAFDPPDMTDGLREDLDRLQTLWSLARGSASGDGPWLFGAYSLADAFYAPVAARIAGYGLPVAANAADYVAAHLAHPSFRRWRAMGAASFRHLERYDQPMAQRTWPGPEPLPAAAVTGQVPLNTACPYSGKPVEEDSLALIDGQVIGFCNTFCRDKSVADAQAWPTLTALRAQL